MTMEEIQSIVANGDSEQPTAALAKNPTEMIDNEVHIRDIVNNVQKVLHSEIVNNNFTQSLLFNKLETPDTSSSWSSILPAIFGNTGDSISANKVVATNGNTADSILVPQIVNKKPTKHKTPTTSAYTKTTPTPTKTTVNKITKQKPKPSWPPSSTITPFKPSTLTHNIKHTPTTKTKPPIKNTFSPISQIPYLKQNTTLLPKPTKLAVTAKPPTSIKPSTIYIQKLPTEKIALSPSFNKSTVPASNVVTATKKPVSKRPITPGKLPSSAFKTPAATIASSIATSTNIPVTVEASIKKNQSVDAQTVLHSHNAHITTTSTKKNSGTTTLKPKTTKITTNAVAAKTKENIRTSTVEYATTTARPTRKTVATTIRTATNVGPQKMNPDAIAVMEPEPENIFDSELSLNQIIESLKDLEGTTIPYASNYMGSPGNSDGTTFETETMQNFERIDAESVTIPNDVDITLAHSNQEKNVVNFKHKITNNVSYIPQTTLDYTSVPPTTQKYNHLNKNYSNTKSQLSAIRFGGIEHKESADEMILDENTSTQTTLSDVVMTTMMDTLLRESFDNVLSQIQNDDASKVVENGIEATTHIPVMKTSDTKKAVVKPTPFIPIPIDELDGTAATKPMKYFEAVIKQYEEERNRTELTNKTELADSTTSKSIDPMLATTTEILELETVATTDLAMSTENYSNSVSENATPLPPSKSNFIGANISDLAGGENSGSDRPYLRDEKITEQTPSKLTLLFKSLLFLSNLFVCHT